MTEPVNALKTAASALIAIVVAPATIDALHHTGWMMLGVPLSMLLMAIGGALIGALLLPEKDANRVSADASRTRGQRCYQAASRWSVPGVVVICYAIVAAWLVAVAVTWLPILAGTPQLPLAGLSGGVIRRMLPGYLKLVERVTGNIGGQGPWGCSFG
jgi:hypothetical protein